MVASAPSSPASHFLSDPKDGVFSVIRQKTLRGRDTTDKKKKKQVKVQDRTPLCPVQVSAPKVETGRLWNCNPSVTIVFRLLGSGRSL